MTSDLPAVSVVISARDAAGTLPATLASVAAQTYGNVVDVIVATADDASGAAAAVGRATVVPNPSGRTASGLNLAIAASIGEVVVRCDAHAILPPGYVERALDTLKRTGADNVGGMQVPVGTTVWEQAIAAAMASPWGAGDARYRIGGEEGPAETVYLGVFRKETLERLGGFDEDFTRTQDYELNHRIIASGGVVWFDPELEVEYRPRGSLGSLARQYLEYGMAKRLFSRKHPGSLRARQLAPPALVTGLLGSLALSFWWTPALFLLPIYLVALLIVSIPGPVSTLRTALALGTMHLSWGWGFLTGSGGVTK